MSVRDRLRSIRVAVVVAGILVPATADAAITFSGVTGAFPGAPYTEGGFTVTATQGTWVSSAGYGNPEPSIFAGPVGSPGVSTIEVTGGTFTFDGLDISSNNGTSTYSFTGFLGAAQVYSLMGGAPASLAPSFGFTAIASGTTAVMDKLVITITPPVAGSTTSINIDNIAVAAASVTVPEPAALALLGFGLLGLAGVARRHETG